MKKFLFAFLLLVGTSATSTTLAAGIPIFYSNGTDFAVLEKLPEEAFENYGETLSFGVAYEQFSLMWIPMWNYGDTEYVLISEDGETGYQLDDEHLAFLKEEYGIDTDARPASKIPFWDKLGGKLIWIAVILFLLWGGIGKKKEEGVVELDNQSDESDETEQTDNESAESEETAEESEE